MNIIRAKKIDDDRTRLVATVLGLLLTLTFCEPLNAQDNVDRTGRALEAEQDSRNTETVVGTVVTPEGEPVSGVEVLVFKGERQLQQKFRTDKQGQFRVPEAWRGSDGYLTLIVRDGDRSLGWFDFFFHAHSDDGQKSADGSFRIVLLPMNRTVRGQLVDTDGNPLSGVTIRFDYLQHEINFAAAHWRYHEIDDSPLVKGVVTDQDGKYELKLPADTFAWLSCTHPDWIGKRIQVAKDSNDVGVTRLSRAAKVVGRVVDSRTGRPLSSVSIAAQATEPDMETGGWSKTKTDTDGRFVIGGLSAGKFVLFLNSSFKTLTAPAQIVTLKTGKESQVDFSLVVGQRLTGKVVDKETNQPVPDCVVHYSGPARPGPAVLGTQTDRNGQFEFYAPPGASRVYIGDLRGRVDGDSVSLNVPTDGEPEPIVLNAGSKREMPMVRIFVGPPLERKVTLNFERARLSDVLKQACQSAGIRLELGKDVDDIQIPVKIRRNRIPLREALEEILEPFDHLSYTINNDSIFVGSRKQVSERQKAIAERMAKHRDVPLNEVSEPAVDPRLNAAYEKNLSNVTIENVLADIAKHFQLGLEIQRNELRVADADTQLSLKFELNTKELYDLLMTNPDGASDAAKSISKRGDGTIRGHEILSLILQPLALDYFIVDDVLHVTTAEIVRERRSKPAKP